MYPLIDHTPRIDASFARHLCFRCIRCPESNAIRQGQSPRQPHCRVFEKGEEHITDNVRANSTMVIHTCTDDVTERHFRITSYSAPTCNTHNSHSRVPPLSLGVPSASREREREKGGSSTMHANVPCCTVRLHFALVYFALGEAPAATRLPSLDENHLGHRLIQNDAAVARHAQLVLNPSPVHMKQ